MHVIGYNTIFALITFSVIIHVNRLAKVPRYAAVIGRFVCNMFAAVNS